MNTTNNNTDIDTSVVYNNIAKEFSNSRSYKWEWVTKFIEEIQIETSSKSNIKSSTDNKNSQAQNLKNIGILDIGCGGGRNIKAYSSNNVKITGIDNSKEFIKICIEECLPALMGNMTSLPFADESFDHILSIASFHHLSMEHSRIKALKEMARVLKPNGRVLMSVWSKNQPKKTKRTLIC